MLDPIHLLTADSSLSPLDGARVPDHMSRRASAKNEVHPAPSANTNPGLRRRRAAQVPPSNPIWAMRIFANHKEKFNLLGWLGKISANFELEG